jgi:predicted DNA-binding WGR domain protein
MKPDYFWIGWNHDGDHDKVWGIIKINDIDAFDGNYVSFWGRRGKKLQTKIYEHAAYWEMESLYAKKEDKGYQHIDLEKLNDVYPEFERDLEKMAFWAQFRV